MKRLSIKAFASLLLAAILCFSMVPAVSADSSEDYNTAQLSALVTFFQSRIKLSDDSEIANYEYAGLEIDFNHPASYPGITWNDTKPYSVTAIDFTAYPKLSGKLDVSSMAKLSSVDVSGTEIDWIKLGQNGDLTDFTAVNSGMLSLDFTECKMIENINITGSYVQSLILPDKPIASVLCSGNFLTFDTLPAGYKIKNYEYMPQRNAFYIGQSEPNAVQIRTKVDMRAYHADTITWYRADGTPLTGVTEVKNQVYTFSDVQIGDYIYAEMTADAYPGFVMRTDDILIDQNSRYVWWYFLGSIFVFFILFFAARYYSAKRNGYELRTDKFTDKIADGFDSVIRSIINKFRKK